MTNTLKIDTLQQDAIDQIIVGLAHELNNPNAVIRMNAMNLIKIVNGLDPSELRSRILQQSEGILQATIRIVAIADKLKQCSADWHSQSSPFHLKETLQEVLNMHQFLLDRCAKVDFQPQGKSFELMGHKLQMEQAFSSLLTNACDAISERFLEENGKESKPGHILIRIAEEGERLRVVFSDNGNGMTPETMKKIFVPYFTTKPQGIGDGLGLPICQAIIIRHGGEIEVKSERFVGTQFTLTLPRNGSRRKY